MLAQVFGDWSLEQNNGDDETPSKNRKTANKQNKTKKISYIS